MAAPTNAALVKKTLANPEPSTHGPSHRFAPALRFGRKRSIADLGRFSAPNEPVAIDPGCVKTRCWI
jgi:hypothetical protein